MLQCFIDLEHILFLVALFGITGFGRMPHLIISVVLQYHDTIDFELSALEFA